MIELTDEQVDQFWEQHQKDFPEPPPTAADIQRTMREVTEDLALFGIDVELALTPRGDT